MGNFGVLSRVAAEQDGMVTAVQALAAGFGRNEIRHLCRSGRWIRVARACFVTTPTVSEAALRRARVRAAVTSLGLGAFAVLDTAAELHRIGGLGRPSAIHVSVPVDRPRPQRLRDPDLVVHQLTVAPGDVREVGGVPATTAVRTLADVVLRLERYPAVCALDSALSHYWLIKEFWPSGGRK